ncbi:MAG: thioredoxin domain-containing protein [Pirellulaceae bacterium]|nr:thioredoxin domain-containing protein [Pirellulaceae bacterium]
MAIATSFLAILIAFLTVSQSNANQTSDCVVLSFTAKWCGPCQEIGPSLAKLTEQGVLIRQVDVDAEKGLVQRWKITALPTMIVLQKGREVDRFIGREGFQSLKARLQQLQLAQSNFVPTKTEPTALAAGSFGNQRSKPTPEASAYGSNGIAFSSGPPNDPMLSTVRIKIEDRQSTSFGSGTIIDQHGDEALILTCGHLFRDLQPQSNVTVDVLVDGQLQTMPASVVDFRCDDTDIGLIAFRPGQPVAAAPLFPRGTSLKEQEPVSSFGCDHGATPTRRDSHITKLNRYLGPANVEVAKAPVQGRSGGGLFNLKGELIGVCYAADGELDEGLFSGPEVVYAQLARLGLIRLYDAAPAPMQVASASIPSTSQLGFPVSATADSFPDRSIGDNWKTAIHQAANVTRDSIANSVASMAAGQQGASLTAVYRDPQGREQRITIPSPSPALLQALHSQAQESHASPIAIR